MCVDQAGHDPLPASVDHVDRPAVPELDVLRQRAHTSDPVALDDDGVVARGRPEPSIRVPLRTTRVFLLAALMMISLSPIGRMDVTPKRAASSTAIGSSQSARHASLSSRARLGVVSSNRIGLIFPAGEE